MKKLTQLSRYLSYVLRHNPEAIELDMSSDGWVSVRELLQKLNQHGKAITLEKLQTIVAQDDKQRYSFNEDESRIRANQGHSLNINLDLTPATPPTYLYHGTATRNLDSIRNQGLLKQNRHHVHLSKDEQTARNVGARYGKPVVLTILAGEMHKAGFIYLCSANHVWLTNTVPVQYISFPDE